MDSDIVFALVLTALFFGGLVWIALHARKQAQNSTNAEQELPESQKNTKRAA